MRRLLALGEAPDDLARARVAQARGLELLEKHVCRGVGISPSYVYGMSAALVSAGRGAGDRAGSLLLDAMLHPALLVGRRR
jgi:hypothetical protein